MDEHYKLWEATKKQVIAWKAAKEAEEEEETSDEEEEVVATTGDKGQKADPAAEALVGKMKAMSLRR